MYFLVFNDCELCLRYSLSFFLTLRYIPSSFWNNLPQFPRFYNSAGQLRFTDLLMLVPLLLSKKHSHLMRQV